MCARHCFRNCCWAADPYTLPIAAPRPWVFWSRAASAIFVLAEDGPSVIAVCTTLAVRSTCSTSNWSRPAYSCAAAVFVGWLMAWLDGAMLIGDLLVLAAGVLPLLAQAVAAAARTAAPRPARTRRELRIAVSLSRVLVKLRSEE